jgi:hypothetical protein
MGARVVLDTNVIVSGEGRDELLEKAIEVVSE